jgi:hypothetical protein
VPWQRGRSRGDDQGLAGTLERAAHRLDGAPVGGDRRLEVGEVVDEREVDDPVGAGGSGAHGVQVVQVAAEHLGSGGGDRGGRVVGPGEPEDLMAHAEELGNDGRADPAGRAGDEYPHEKPPDVSRCHQRSTPMPVTVIT